MSAPLIRVSSAEVTQLLERVLRALGFSPQRAQLAARLFAESSRDGVLSHGLHRFPRFVEQVRRGVVDVNAEPRRVAALGAFERWDGHRGPGMLNAHACMNRAIELARAQGLGGVALCNTNHWMRGGSYGWQAAEAGVIGICWTNTMANLPPWGSSEERLGNNPLVIAVPHAQGPVVLDMAMSQFSFGALESHRLRGQRLPVDGGFDREGQLTRDPAAIEESRRALPIGYWKGSGLALLLDLMAALLAGGAATHQIPRNFIQESALSQVFLAFDLPSIDQAGAREEAIAGILASLRGPGDAEPIRYPGERVQRLRRESDELGLAVDPGMWAQIVAMPEAQP
jgi:3-dehydro-L-gulonate 2-dehydrogenase